MFSLHSSLSSVFSSVTGNKKHKSSRESAPAQISRGRKIQVEDWHLGLGMYWQPEHHQCNSTVSPSGATWVLGKPEMIPNKKATAPQSYLTNSVPQSTWQRHQGITVNFYPSAHLDTSKSSMGPSAVKPDMKVQIFLPCLSLSHRGSLQREGWWQRTQQQQNKSKLKQTECPSRAGRSFYGLLMCYASGICPTATRKNTAQPRVAASRASPLSTPAAKHLLLISQRKQKA